MKLTSLVPFGQRSVTRFNQSPFGTLQHEIDRLLGNGSLPSLMPNIDVTENDKEIEVSAELPGLERKDVDISIEDGTLTIRGEKKLEEEKKDQNYHLTERSYGSFYRELLLPRGVDPSSVRATMSKGVLKVTIPRPAHSETKKIEVKEAA